MPSILELQQFAANQNAMKEANNPLIGIASQFGSYFKEQEEKKRAQQNMKEQLATSEKMMQQMAQYGDLSTTGKGNNVLSGSSTGRNQGIKGISTMLPVFEQTIDEKGLPNMKIGMRYATPAEQESQFKTQQAQIQAQREEAKRQVLNDYQNGTIDEGMLSKEANNLGITSQELSFNFDLKRRSDENTMARQQALQAQQASQMQQDGTMPSQQQIAKPQPSNAIPEGFKPVYKADTFGQMRPAGYEPMTPQDIEAQRKIQSEDKDNEIKSQNSIKMASETIKTIDHLIKNKNYFGSLEGRILPVFPGKIKFDKNFKNLQANAVIDVLSKMKSQSRTGATGFGALNEKELGIIIDSASKLDTKLDENTAEEYLNEMKANLQTIIDREKNGYENVGQMTQGQITQSITPEQAMAELKRRGKL